MARYGLVGQPVIVSWSTGVGRPLALKVMQDRAARYRDIATEVRAQANTVADEHDRQAMLKAALVWERLADLAEKTVPPAPDSFPRQPGTSGGH